MIIETERLILRELTQDDYFALCKIIQDEETMYAYVHALSDEEAHEWLDRQIARYHEFGFGPWAVILKSSGELIGQCGLSMQDCGKGALVHEIGYQFQKAFWHMGYATEAAAACKKHAFEALDVDEVYSIIRDMNTASIGVAKRNGMEQRSQFVKHYKGVDMLHLVFSVRKFS